MSIAGNTAHAGLTWFKSSYSGAEGGTCLEAALGWRTSTYSTGSGGECLEISPCPTAVHIRDSKDKSGPVLSLPSAAWTAFLGYARESEVA